MGEKNGLTFNLTIKSDGYSKATATATMVEG